MHKFKDFSSRLLENLKNIDEGVYDQSKLKAIFLAGGPGSGKSYVSGYTTTGLGFKHINSDDLFEKKMKEHGLDFKMPEHEQDQRDVLRHQAKQLTKKKYLLHAKNRQGLVIDGTGKDYDDIEEKSNHLRNLGYDTHMIFVNTSLDVAHQRNKKRARSVPDHIVHDSWKQVQSNIGKFQNHFGRNKFIVVDNNDAKENVLNKVHKQVRALSGAEVENPIGKQWVSSELEKKNRLK